MYGVRERFIDVTVNISRLGVQGYVLTHAGVSSNLQLQVREPAPVHEVPLVTGMFCAFAQQRCCSGLLPPLMH
jgi:hypothetical protein